MSAGQSQPIDVDAIRKNDLEKAKTSPFRRDCKSIPDAFENVKRINFQFQICGGRCGNEKKLYRALAQLCKSSDSDKLRPCFQYEYTRDGGFESKLDETPSEALRAAWEAAFPNLQDADDKTLERVHRELFYMAQITTLAIELAMHDHDISSSTLTSTSKREGYKVKMTKIDAYGSHLVQNADPKEQSLLKDQIEEIKRALQPFIE